MLRLLWQFGMLPERILIPKKGTSMAYENGDFVPAGAVSAGDVLIDGNAIGDVGNVVLRDRKVLSEDGIFIVAITVNRREKKIVAKARVHTRGFVYLKKSRDILRESSELIKSDGRRLSFKEMTLTGQILKGRFVII